ncbi:MAG: hypothetical protein HOP15_13180, partial [Planctomycetes bacterium]|nr:hypothetical protein [Planctomycetota bacterium]
AEGWEASSAAEQPHWAREKANGAWLDGFVDWTDELRTLARRGVPSYLVENRSAAREWASFVVHPNLCVAADAWERVHAARVLRGPEWIPLRREVRALRPAPSRTLDLLVTFGGSDPLGSTERVLAALPTGLRVAVSVGAHMQPRRGAIERAAEKVGAEVLPTNAALGPWMARARVAITALGTTLYELAYLGTSALVLANYASDRPVLEGYRQAGLFEPLGLASEFDERALGATLRAAFERVRAPSAPSAEIRGLGEGAARLAERLLASAPVPLAA